MNMEKIENSHGAGGKVMQRLLEEVIIPSFGNRRLGEIGLDEMDDGATLLFEKGNLIVCSDAHTVQPLHFPGGSIGTLTACGTVNDLAVMGAKPIAMTNTVIVEEGFEIQQLAQILKDLNNIIEPLDIAMIAGDTKVMPRGTLDQLVFSTTGIGVSYLEEPITDRGALPGDDILVTGPIGDHGTALLAHREGLEFDTDLVSDVAPLWEPLRDCLDVGGVHSMKDPTRGGTSVAFNEIASKSKVQIVIEDGAVPVRPAVRSLCEILGLDFFNMSCEGTAVMAVDPTKTDDLIDTLHSHKATSEAKAIGKVEEGSARVILETGIGGRKVIQVPYGEPVPRVC